MIVKRRTAAIQPTVDAVVKKGAKNKAKGDGGIFVMPTAEYLRVRTGEQGNNAIG